VCCSAVQCVAVCQWGKVEFPTVRARYSNVLQCVAVCFSMFQCVAVYHGMAVIFCSVLMFGSVWQ